MTSNGLPRPESVSASAPANGGGRRTALASLCQLAADFSRTPGAGITHFHQPGLSGRWNGGVVGLGGAAWFRIRHGNVEWLGTLLWPVFLFWQLFPLMATAFTQNVESANLLRFPLSYRSYFLIRLAYGSLDPGTAVASLWLLGIDVGIGSRPAARAPLGYPRLLIFALVNIVLPRMLFAGLLAGWPSGGRAEILGSFLSLGPEFSADRALDHSLRTSLHAKEEFYRQITLGRTCNNAFP